MGEYHEGAHRAIALAGGVPQTPFFIRASPCGGYPQTPSEGRPSDFSINPNPFFIRRGFEPLPKPLANPWQGDVIDCGQRPPFVKGFLYGSQSLCPFGASHGLFTSLLSPPLEKGLKERETTNAPKAPCRKGFKERGGKTPQRHQTGRELNRGDDKHRKSIKRERGSTEETTNAQKLQAGRELNLPAMLNAGR